MTRTLRGWREHRGLSREELAGLVGVTARMIERWEEIGLDVEAGSRYGDYLVNRLVDALDAGEGLRLEHAPSEPNPGDLVITPGEGMDVEDLLERAEELNVRVTVPDRFGLSLKPLKDVSGEDHSAIARHFDRERTHSEAVLWLVEATLEMLGGNSGEWKEGQTMGERLEEIGRELGEDLDFRGGPA